jgi:UDP-N-acetylglucosamine:LPS N-acetylglucosamine transferase
MMEEKVKRVVFISSTGGHLSELLKLESMFKEYDYRIITEKDKSNEYLKEKYGQRVSYLPYCTRNKIISYIFIYTFLIIKTIYLFIKIRPDVIISTGTHTAVPMCYLGKIFGKQIIYIETLANINRKTLTGKIIYPIANLFIVQWRSMIRLYPNAIYVGGTDDISSTRYTK